MSDLHTFRAVVQYDGTDFAGYQWQHGVRTVQGELERAISQRCSLAGRITAAGRTDTGVHALGQVISFSGSTPVPLDKLTVSINSVLNQDISISRVDVVQNEFNARFSASSRTYVYLILNTDTRSALYRRYSTHVKAKLDTSAMQLAAGYLIGEQNFASFANELKPDQTPWRDVMRCDVVTRRQLVFVRIEANAFLRGMVRNIVGTLIDVGKGKRTADCIPEIIAKEDRRSAGPCAPPQGLCLARVSYGVRKLYNAHSLDTKE